MKVALRHRGIIYEPQRPVTIVFENEEVGVHRLDLIVEGQIIVELKAVKALEDIHFLQVKSYLKATKLGVGLLFNFNSRNWSSSESCFQNSIVRLRHRNLLVSPDFALSHFRHFAILEEKMPKAGTGSPGDTVTANR